MQTSLIFHIVRKDLRHVGLLFGVWLFLLLAQAFLLGLGYPSGAGSYVWQTAYTLLALAIPLLQGLVIVILLPILIQDEPLVGTTASWFTRPISRATLLAAKATFAVIFLIVPPIMIDAGMFLANHITLGDTLAALPNIAYGSAVRIIAIAALSVLTPSFARYFLWLVVIFICTTGVLFVAQILKMFFWPEYALARDASLMSSRGIAAGIISATGFGFVVVWQYLTRRTFTGVLVLIATVLLSLLTQLSWPFDILARPERAVEAPEFGPDSVQLSLSGSVSNSESVRLSPRTGPAFDISAPIGFSKVPPGYQAVVTAIAQAEFLAPGGSSVPSLPLTSPYSSGWWKSAMSFAIGGMPVLNAADPEKRRTSLLRLPTKDFEKWKNTPGKFQATVILRIERIAEIARLPLQTGAQIRQGSRSIEVSDILRETAGCTVILRERNINSVNRLKRILERPLDSDRGQYILVNRSRSEAILPDEEHTFQMTAEMFQNSLPLVNRSFPLRFTGKGSGLKLTPEWLEGAKLAVLDATTVGILHRELTATDFLLSPKK